MSYKAHNWYAGIGSRTTPKDILLVMQEFAYQAAQRGIGLRTGAAPGADSAFELGAIDAMGDRQIFLPWKGFANHDSPLYNTHPLAEKFAETVHPVWNVLSPAAKKLVARNMHQILGPDLDDPVQMVVCWTRDGCESREKYGPRTGGTGTAIAFASSLDIPVFNLWHGKRLKEALTFMESLV